MSDFSNSPEWVEIDMKVRSRHSMSRPAARNRPSISRAPPQMLNWSYTDFRLVVPTDASLGSVRRAIREKYGEMRDLKLCTDRFCAKNELVGDHKTLGELGFRGGARSTVYFDYLLRDGASSDRVLLSWHL